MEPGVPRTELQRKRPKSPFARSIWPGSLCNSPCLMNWPAIKCKCHTKYCEMVSRPDLLTGLTPKAVAPESNDGPRSASDLLRQTSQQ